jgi:hypothetical protein
MNRQDRGGDTLAQIKNLYKSMVSPLSAQTARERRSKRSPLSRRVEVGTLLISIASSLILSAHAGSLNSRDSIQSAATKPQPGDATTLIRFESNEWGVTFRYPANYVFKEWNKPVQHNSSWILGQIDDHHAGEVLIATVEIPKQLFTGTDLTSAVFGLSANRYLTKDECWVAASGNRSEVYTITLAGIEFHGSEGGDAPTAAGFRDYAGFSNGVCYEIETVIATTRFGPPPGIARVDQTDLDRRMKALLNSLKISPNSPLENSPEIRSFTIEPRPQERNIYRLNWRVTGASETQVTIDLDCYADFSLIEITDALDGTQFRCGELKTLTRLEGSLDLKIENHAGVALKPEFRLLALGRNPASQIAKISVTTQAVIFGPTLNGQFIGKVDVYSMFPGVASGLFGEAFSARETIWIGSTSLSAESLDGRHLSFAVPISLPAGTVPLYIEDERGSSNQMMVNIVRSQPRINFAVPAADRASYNQPLVLGQRARVVGVGFTAYSIVFIGTTSTPAEGDPRFPQYGLYFTVPTSLKPGSYRLYVSDELGKSNEVAVIITDVR